MDASTQQHEVLERITHRLQQDMRAWEADQQREDHDRAHTNVSAEKQKLPFVTLTYAQSIDGSIAAVRGAPTLLSGALSMKMTHALRTMHDAILVGVGTIIADNPSLNTRFAEALLTMCAGSLIAASTATSGRNPQPVIVDTQLRCPVSIKLFASTACEKPIILCAESACDTGLLERKQALEAAGARVIECRTIRNASDFTRVDIRHGLELLRAAAGLRSVMVEGGAAILTACLRESVRSHLVDTVVVTIAPTFIGGLRAVDALAGHQAAAAPTTTAPARFPRLRQPQYHPLEQDLVIIGRL